MTLYDFRVDPTDMTTSAAWQIHWTADAHRVLEIGCATGFVSRHLVARGQEVVGVECNPSVADLARTTCQHVITGDIEEAVVQAQITQRFDAVLLGDVLEHLRAPGALLVTIRQRWLQPGGWVVLSVPNSGHWIFRREVLQGRFPYRQYGLFDQTHLRFFTCNSLYQMIHDSGYTVVKATSTINHNSHDDLTFASLRWFYRNRPDFRRLMNALEYRLSRLFPTLFTYQFVLCICPIRQ